MALEDKLTYIYIELPKFKKEEKSLTSRFDKWLYVLKHLSELQDRPKGLQDKIFKKLFEAAEIANFTIEERQAYEDSLKYYRDIKNVVDTAKEEKALEIAKTLKSNNISIELIMESTGLSKEEIENL